MLAIHHLNSIAEKKVEMDCLSPSKKRIKKEKRRSYNEEEEMYSGDSSNKGSGEKESEEVSAGRWTKEEHQKFVEALRLFGKNWKKVQEYVGTRTTTQARSHAQKYFAKYEKAGAGASFPERKSSSDGGESHTQSSTPITSPAIKPPQEDKIVPKGSPKKKLTQSPKRKLISPEKNFVEPLPRAKKSAEIVPKNHIVSGDLETRMLAPNFMLNVEESKGELNSIMATMKLNTENEGGENVVPQYSIASEDCDDLFQRPSEVDTGYNLSNPINQVSIICGHSESMPSFDNISLEHPKPLELIPVEGPASIVPVKYEDDTPPFHTADFSDVLFGMQETTHALPNSHL